STALPASWRWLPTCDPRIRVRSAISATPICGPAARSKPPAAVARRWSAASARKSKTTWRSRCSSWVPARRRPGPPTARPGGGLAVLGVQKEWLAGFSMTGGGALMVGLGLGLDHVAEGELDAAARAFNANVRSITVPILAGEF